MRGAFHKRFPAMEKRQLPTLPLWTLFLFLTWKTSLCRWDHGSSCGYLASLGVDITDMLCMAEITDWRKFGLGYHDWMPKTNKKHSPLDFLLMWENNQPTLLESIVIRTSVTAKSILTEVPVTHGPRWCYLDINGINPLVLNRNDRILLLKKIRLCKVSNKYGNLIFSHENAYFDKGNWSIQPEVSITFMRSLRLMVLGNSGQDLSWDATN